MGTVMTMIQVTWWVVRPRLTICRLRKGYSRHSDADCRRRTFRYVLLRLTFATWTGEELK